MAVRELDWHTQLEALGEQEGQGLVHRESRHTALEWKTSRLSLSFRDTPLRLLTRVGATRSRWGVTQFFGG